MLSSTQFSRFKTHSNLLQINSTRVGGSSTEPYHFLNLGMHSGDDRQTVHKNRTHFFNILAIPENRLVFPEQVHSDNVIWVQDPGIVRDCDALVTNVPNLFLTIQTADCFPVFLFDPMRQVIAIIHSGWRGTAKNIVQKAIRLMSENGNSLPEDILAGIGPGIQQSCYQVDEKTSSHFDTTYLIPDGPGHFKLDVQGAILDQLLDAEIKWDNIEVDSTCTHCAKGLYYSYRRDGQRSGRMMGVIGFRSKNLTQF